MAPLPFRHAGADYDGGSPGPGRGLNFGSWHLRQRSSVEVTSGRPASYQNIATYLAHDIPSIRSDLTVGDSFTDGAVFDSFGFRGVSLASDDQMLPDSQLEYAPIVHGIARTNARVVVTQNGNTILETTVSPGAFEINDLYATGYGGDLHVTVYEADGSQDSFTVPYASVVQLLRPGVWRYTAVAGEVKQPSLSGSEHFTLATVQHGFNSYLTGYTGAVGAQHYAAGLLGIAVNTVVGALAADVTEARAAITDTYSSSGQSLRFSYSKLVRDTKTNITLATYRYSSSGYYSFSDAQSAWVAARASSTPDTIARARSQWLININQSLPGRWGNFYLTASVRDYWQSSGTTTQFQGGYTNHFRFSVTSLSYSISVARQNNRDFHSDGQLRLEHGNYQHTPDEREQQRGRANHLYRDDSQRECESAGHIADRVERGRQDGWGHAVPHRLELRVRRQCLYHPERCHDTRQHHFAAHARPELNGSRHQTENPEQRRTYRFWTRFAGSRHDASMVSGRLQQYQRRTAHGAVLPR